MDGGLILCGCFLLSKERSPAYPQAQQLFLSAQGRKEQEGREASGREEGFCKGQVSWLCLGDGI